jgi:inosine-uridine nucleoside N-ribohydrolase
MTKKMIIDTDVGIDDAIAILMGLANPEWQIVGVCGVSGNVGLEHVMRNIGVVLDAAGAGDVPIFRGADRPLIAPLHHAASVHGDDGLGDVGWPASPMSRPRRRSCGWRASTPAQRCWRSARSPTWRWRWRSSRACPSCWARRC